MHDPYAFPPLLTDYDLHLLTKGRIGRATSGWAPNCGRSTAWRASTSPSGRPTPTSVSVVGDFNDWDGRRHPMRKHIPSGVWELFVPGLSEGTLYKFQIAATATRCSRSPTRTASPPKCRRGRPPWWPTSTATTGTTTSGWTAAPEHQLARRSRCRSTRCTWAVGSGPATIRTRWLSYRELAHQLVDYCQEMGYTHIELLPVSEHPFTGSWGYQTVGYFAATSRYGTPQDFMYFVDHCHQNGIGVIIDWVPAHFPRDGHGLRRFDGTALYEHADPRQGEHRDWGTMIFNYGRNEVRNFLLSNALFWLDKYHIDGLRVDAVASMLYLDYSREEGEWIPNEFGGRENLEAIDFLKEFNEQAHLQYPGVLTIAEESTAWAGVSRPTYLGGLGFSLKWNMGWMNDTLRYMRHEPIHRKYHHDELTFSLIYAFTENFVLPLSHDEVVHGKGSLLDQMPGDLWQKFANLRLLYGYMWTHPGKKLLFMGGEFGQWNEWNYDASAAVGPAAVGVAPGAAEVRGRPERALPPRAGAARGRLRLARLRVDRLPQLRRQHAEPTSARPRTRTTSCWSPATSRRCRGTSYRLGVPEPCWYEEIFNSDSTYYGGSNVGNGPGVIAEDIPSHGRPYSISMTLPPLAAVIFKPRR